MRNLLFSSRLKPGYELYAFLGSILVAIVLIGIGFFAAHFIDILPNPTCAGYVAILSVALLWFWVLRNYRFLAALNIATAGFIGFASFDKLRENGQYVIPLVLISLVMTLRYYSEGPTRT